MAWWLWVAGGFVLGIVEVLAPGYVFLGFALGALAVGLGLWTGLLTLALPAQIAVFALVSVAAWAVLRRIFPHQRGEVKRWTRDIND
ncbi:hypothetical protein D2N39_05195 [Gemmobacter lutimaris]|uniref:NfeD family protein n=1 Tax=Gemmobacter lutimaris TaxID=2306023 RepID=A0A398BYP1_9RHOB|nr:hypothetical protein [Gemmobacter lutimaris]RID93050.1 hypothetical protein D2N39_05195 [Gemmobacter lutimaris]